MSAETVDYYTDETPDYVQLNGFVEVHGAVSETTLTVPTGPLARSEIIHLANGFGAFKKTTGPLAVALAMEGTASVHSAPIRGSSRSPLEDMADATRVHLDAHTAIFNYLSSNREIRNLPHGDQLSMTKRINAGHSYGGKVALENALQHPDEVEHLVLIQSVGLEEPHKLRYARRIAKFVRTELVPFLQHHGPEFGINDGLLALEHFFGNPFQTIGEAWACNQSDMRHLLPRINAHNIGLAVLGGTKDTLTPAAPMREYAKPYADYYKEMPVSHLGPQQYPDVVSYFVNESLDYLARRNEADLNVKHGTDLISNHLIAS